MNQTFIRNSIRILHDVKQTPRITISGCINLIRVTFSNTENCLETLEIVSCPNLSVITFFPDTITNISLINCGSLKNIPKFPTNLKKLSIISCGRITIPYLPEKLEIIYLHLVPIHEIPKAQNMFFSPNILDIWMTHTRIPKSQSDIYKHLTNTQKANITSFYCLSYWDQDFSKELNVIKRFIRKIILYRKKKREKLSEYLYDDVLNIVMSY